MQAHPTQHPSQQICNASEISYKNSASFWTCHANDSTQRCSGLHLAQDGVLCAVVHLASLTMRAQTQRALRRGMISQGGIKSTRYCICKHLQAAAYNHQQKQNKQHKRSRAE